MQLSARGYQKVNEVSKEIVFLGGTKGKMVGLVFGCGSEEDVSSFGEQGGPVIPVTVSSIYYLCSNRGSTKPLQMSLLGFSDHGCGQKLID